MKHIRQKDLTTYTIVIITDWIKPLEEHPSIMEHPEVFEIADCEIPEEHQYLNYIQLTNQ
jgi:hypothetical protein